MLKQIDGINLHYRERGTGDTALIFLHYFGGSSRSWHEVVNALSDKYRCIAPDLRGFGDSEATRRGYSIEDSADDMAALVEALGVEKFVIIGHSMGGKIALEWASRRPEGLQKVILLAPSPPTPEPMEEAERHRLEWGFGSCAAIRETLDKITVQDLSARVFERALDDSLRSSRAAWKAWLHHGSREDITDEMSNIEVPVTVVAGDNDQSLNAELLQCEVVERLESASLITLPDCGHLLPLEAPRRVANLICATVM